MYCHQFPAPFLLKKVSIIYYRDIFITYYTGSDECDSFDCGNGTCTVDKPGSFTCVCPPGYTFILEQQQCIGNLKSLAMLQCNLWPWPMA